MAEPKLVFDGVWKKFRRGSSHDSLRDLLPSTFARLMGRGRAASDEAKHFWALRDLSFEVAPGEILGIIGANGAGKSTTLKILNRIMDPTHGEVRVEGRIGALIEVSAGFHPDLTGRQNVFLQGAIMGMRKQEVNRKFDDIVDFAGVSDFIDTPVKRYSSGMNARLGFSIAAHLEPDVLIIDEVLAVGDHAFQAKAFERIRMMARGGAPVVLVSHQLDRVLELCTKAILLDRGEVRATGTASHCINQYLHSFGAGVNTAQYGEVGIEILEVTSTQGLAVRSGEVMTIKVSGTSDGKRSDPNWTPGIRVVDSISGTSVHSVTGLERGIDLPTGPFEYDITMQMNLPPGSYHIDVNIWDLVARTDVSTGPRLQIEVLENKKFWGSVQLNCSWSARPASVVP
jgi:lipopolysaccharide transport system ATP-binding protein